ncbi:hypothetical protein NHX12_008409 [Muraenolepis orangiensis]|uniref:Ubiquitin carboxyl-terminal hydrolase MINDY n=1 Tax=Muraenolepis orangiensis TaxID=630683 RepID=A0A9Q0IA56_9TELE|nr:hypothetical protein NHX12_008409 [Muraenolepis orangiensis]
MEPDPLERSRGELGEIRQQIHDLGKWRDIFNHCGLEFKHVITRQEEREEVPGREEEREEVPGREEEREEVLGSEEEREEVPGSKEERAEVPGREEEREEVPGSSRTETLWSRTSPSRLPPAVLQFKEEGSNGVIMFLYSLICSRTIGRLQKDLDWTTSHLLQLRAGSLVCHQALVNLLLTGRASPHVFNGTLSRGADGHCLERPLHGVKGRSQVGFLHWSREQQDRQALSQVGSMLKTPRFPIWVCSINRTHSVLFSPKASLLSDWKMEHLFQLYFYNGQPTRTSTTALTIDTHSHHWEECSGALQGESERRFSSLEMTIRTKWHGAAINWNGTAPFY